VSVGLSIEPEWVVLRVADTGIGIAPEDIERALAPFQQVDGDLNRRYEGTGLGLTITSSLVEMHGGRLTLDSAVGVGTTATIRLPAWRLEKAREALLEHENAAEAA
jgi:signal transduction histidine kinase